RPHPPPAATASAARRALPPPERRHHPTEATAGTGPHASPARARPRPARAGALPEPRRRMRPGCSGAALGRGRRAGPTFVRGNRTTALTRGASHRVCRTQLLIVQPVIHSLT